MRLSRLMNRRRPSGERGAVAVLVTAFVALGVLLGASAISIDVGSLYAQRRQVQNGADAAAFAFAKTCALTKKCLASSAPSLGTLVGQNGRGTLSDSSTTPSYSTGLCVKNLPAGTTTDLPACGASSGTFIDCPAMNAAVTSLPYVEVHTQTLVNGTHILPPVVAGALGFGGANVQACARALFGPSGPGTEKAMPIAMSYCDWKAAVNYPATPGTFQNPPVGAWPGYGTANPWPSTEQTVSLAKDESACPTWNGHPAPGGFGWLTQDASSCSATITNGWVAGNTGNNYQCDLSPYLGKVAYMPIFDCVSATQVSPITSATDCTTSAHGSGNTWYHIAGYAALYVSGWNIGSSHQASVRPPGAVPTCMGPGSSGSCVSGWFTQELASSLPVDTSGGSGTPGFGTPTVHAAG